MLYLLFYFTAAVSANRVAGIALVRLEDRKMKPGIARTCYIVRLSVVTGGGQHNAGVSRR